MKLFIVSLIATFVLLTVGGVLYDQMTLGGIRPISSAFLSTTK